MSAALHRRLRAVGAALAQAGRIHPPPGPAAAWTDDDAARAGVLLDTCGQALLARLDGEALAVLAARLGEREQGGD